MSSRELGQYKLGNVMLYFIIERFKDGNYAAAGERFHRQGRMMPDGVRYLASWLEPTGGLCFQVMEAPDLASLDIWMSRWNDLIDFEVHDVETSKDFWARVRGTRDAAMPYRERIERALGSRDPIEVLETTAGEVQRIVMDTPEQVLRAQPFDGKWSPCEIIGHLVDAELIFSIRLRAMLAENEPALPNWRQDDWVERQRYNDSNPTELASQFDFLRRMNLPVWKSLTPDDLARGGWHSSRGRETVADMLRITAGHDLLHLDQMRRSIAAVAPSKEQGDPASRRIPWVKRTFRFDTPAALHPEMIERLRGTPARIDELAESLPADVLTRRDAIGWSIQENIGHLADLEELTMTRLEQLLRSDPVLLPADMTNRKTHEANHNSRPSAEVRAEFRRLRTALIDRLEQLRPDNFARSAMHPRLYKPMRLIDLLEFACEHDDYHLVRMRELARKFVAGGHFDIDREEKT